MQRHKPFFLWRHLNKLRWVTLSVVFAMLVLLPFLHVYQTYVAAHAYDLLAPSERQIYDVMEALTAPVRGEFVLTRRPRVRKGHGNAFPKRNCAARPDACPHCRAFPV